HTADSASFTLEGLCPADYTIFAIDSNECLHEINFTIDEPNNINEYTFAPSINIYPNPANEKVAIENAPIGAQISIIDIYGKHILTQKTVAPVHYVNTALLLNGIYHIRIDSKEHITHKKLIISR